MDRIKAEPNLEAEIFSVTSPDEEKCIDIKQEAYHLPIQSSFIKQEVTVSIFLQNMVTGYPLLQGLSLTSVSLCLSCSIFERPNTLA
jgi:hypothetical protein